jgi:hypothetical protein
MTKRIKRNPTPSNPKVAGKRSSRKAAIFTSSNPNVAAVLDNAEGIEPLQGANLTQQMDDLVVRFNTAWRQTVESIIESGRILIEAKRKVGHGNWMPFLEKIKLDNRKANYLMEIAEHTVLSNLKHAANLPRCWYTLARMAQFEPSELEELLDKGTIDSQTERNEVEALLAKRDRRGHAKFDQIVEALATLNKFVKHWPDLNPVLVEQLSTDLTSAAPKHIDIEDHAGLDDLPKISGWLTKLQQACTETVERWQQEANADDEQEPIVIRKKKRRQPFVQHEARVD